MSDDETTRSDPPEPAGTSARPDQSEQEREDAGAREQGVRTEHSSDLSSPQLTEPAEERGQERGEETGR